MREEECCVAPNAEPTIDGLDEQLAVIVQRASSISDDLNAGVYGNSNKCSDQDKAEMESPSLASIQRRINDLIGHLADIERLTHKFHSSKCVTG